MYHVITEDHVKENKGSSKIMEIILRKKQKNEIFLDTKGRWKTDTKRNRDLSFSINII